MTDNADEMQDAESRRHRYRGRLRPWMDIVYVYSFFVQLLASAVWLGGLVWIGVSRASSGSVWLTGISVSIVVLCMLVRRYIQRWFRRHWPIK